MNIESKTVAIIATDEFEDVELEFPLLRLSEEGADVILVPYDPFAGESKPVTGRYGSPMPPEVIEEGNRYGLGFSRRWMKAYLRFFKGSKGLV